MLFVVVGVVVVGDVVVGVVPVDVAIGGGGVDVVAIVVCCCRMPLTAINYFLEHKTNSSQKMLACFLILAAKNLRLIVLF